jgi:hypothetical protein
MINDRFLRYCLAHRKASGQAVTELALILPIIILLLIGVIEFGFLLYAHVQVANAVREAARAASLYRSTRFSTFYGDANPPKCDGTITGWSLQQTVDQAVVYRKLKNDNCPDANGTILYTALGLLNPTPASPSPMWQVVISPAQNGDTMPDVGQRATVTLTYPYRPLIVSNLIPYLRDPIMIKKAVQFEYQD